MGKRDALEPYLMLANNYKVLCFRLQNVSNYGDTANAAKAGLVRKIQTPKFLRGFAADFTKNVISNFKLTCVYVPSRVI